MKLSKDRVYGFLLLIAGVALVLMYIFDLQPLNDRAEEYLERGIKNTLASYLIVRGINAGVSVVKESEISLSPAGIGVSLALGEVLDPLDDITERVSSLLLVSFVSFGVQRILLELLSGALLLVSGVLSILSGIFLLSTGFHAHLLTRLLLFLIALRLLVPGAVFVNDLVYTNFLQPRLEATNRELSEAKGSFTSGVTGLRSPDDVRELVRDMKKGAERAIENLLHLALYYSFQTVVLPLLSLWLILRLSLSTFSLRL